MARYSRELKKRTMHRGARPHPLKGFPLVISGRNTRISTRRQEKADEAVKRLEEQEAEVEGNLRYEIFQFPNIVVWARARD